MTIDELNKLLSERQPDGIVKAKMSEIEHSTNFLDNDGNIRITLNPSKRWVSGCYPLSFSNGFFELAAPYVHTPIDKRKPEKKYNIILFKDIDDNNPFLTMVTKDDDGMIIRTNEDCDNSDKSDPDYQFTESEINLIIKQRPEFEDIIKASMFEVENYEA